MYTSLPLTVLALARILSASSVCTVKTIVVNVTETLVVNSPSASTLATTSSATLSAVSTTVPPIQVSSRPCSQGTIVSSTCLVYTTSTAFYLGSTTQFVTMSSASPIPTVYRRARYALYDNSTTNATSGGLLTSTITVVESYPALSSSYTGYYNGTVATTSTIPPSGTNSAYLVFLYPASTTSPPTSSPISSSSPAVITSTELDTGIISTTQLFNVTKTYNFTSILVTITTETDTSVTLVTDVLTSIETDISSSTYVTSTTDVLLTTETSETTQTLDITQTFQTTQTTQTTLTQILETSTTYVTSTTATSEVSIATAAPCLLINDTTYNFTSILVTIATEFDTSVILVTNVITSIETDVSSSTYVTSTTDVLLTTETLETTQTFDITQTFQTTQTIQTTQILETSTTYVTSTTATSEVSIATAAPCLLINDTTYITNDGSQYVLYCEMDMVGNDYFSISSGSGIDTPQMNDPYNGVNVMDMESCISACHYFPLCTGATWNSETDTCTLKSGFVDNPTTAEQVESAFLVCSSSPLLEPDTPGGNPSSDVWIYSGAYNTGGQPYVEDYESGGEIYGTILGQGSYSFALTQTIVTCPGANYTFSIQYSFHHPCFATFQTSNYLGAAIIDVPSATPLLDESFVANNGGSCYDGLGNPMGSYGTFTWQVGTFVATSASTNVQWNFASYDTTADTVEVGDFVLEMVL